MLKSSLGIPKKPPRRLSGLPEILDLQQLAKQAEVHGGSDYGLSWKLSGIEFKLYVRYEVTKILWRMWSSGTKDVTAPWLSQERDFRIVLRQINAVCNEVAGVKVARAQSLSGGTASVVSAPQADDSAFIAGITAPPSTMEIALLKESEADHSLLQVDESVARNLTASLMRSTLQLARWFADQINRERTEQKRQIVITDVGEIVDFLPVGLGTTNVEEKVFRWRASTVNWCLSARGRSGLLELFLLPQRDAVSVGIASHEINPVGRIELSLCANQVVWTQEGAPVSPHEVRRMLLKGMTALVAGDLQSSDSVDRELEMRNLSQRIVSQQEEVQKRIARDLHDAVIADLTLLKRAVLNEPPLGRDNVAQSIDGVVVKLREICYELAPSDLKDWGLNTTLEALLEQVAQRTGANCMLNFVDNIPSLDSFIELHIFRIIQEALNNAAKYSGASHISVTAELKHGWLSFEVRDNGKGFEQANVASATRHGGMGRASMQERVEMIRSVFPARLDVTSQPGQGTTTTLFIKVNN